MFRKMIIDTELPEPPKLANFKRHVNNKPWNVLLHGLRIQNSFHSQTCQSNT